MNKDILQPVRIAEKRVTELLTSGDLKKMGERDSLNVSAFYKERSNNRLETARLIFTLSKEKSNYSDYSESVSAAYYAMYYMVHSFIAQKYRIKLREQARGVHAITNHIVLYYLVKTNKLAQYLYENYLKTLETVSQVQGLTVEDFKEEALGIAEYYDKARDSREIFTYSVSRGAEEHHAEKTIAIAEEFIHTLKQLLVR